MAREKFKTLTEQMYYILLCLQEEACGVDIMKMVEALTKGRVVIGPGTLYSLLDTFAQEGVIMETKMENRKKSYIITQRGAQMLAGEYQRLCGLAADYEALIKEGMANEG